MRYIEKYGLLIGSSVHQLNATHATNMTGIIS